MAVWTRADTSEDNPKGSNQESEERSVIAAIELLNRGDLEPAAQAFEALLKLTPHSTEALFGRALALGRLGKSREAQSNLTRLLEIQPTHERGRLVLEELKRNSRDGGTMETVQVETLLDEALVLLADHKPEEALKRTIEAKKSRVAVRDLDYIRGLCFIELQRLWEAREAMKEELRHFSDNKPAQELLTQIDQELGPQAKIQIEDEEFRGLLEIVRPYTMLSIERLYTLFTHAKRICTENLPGNFIECGVAAGGSSALLAYIIKRYSRQPRWLYAFDSYSGMPPATAVDIHSGVAADDTGWGTGTCAAPEDSVREACSKVGALDVLRTVKGYFEETLPQTRDHVGMIALLHLDGDWYESTKAILHNLYDHIVDDGYLQVDDYGYWEGCKKAIHEFEAERKVRFGINTIDGTGVWFIKPDRFPINSNVSNGLVADFFRDDPVGFGLVSQMAPNERFQLYYTVRNLVRTESNVVRFAEVGSFAGGSLLQSYIGLKRSFPTVRGYAVEPEGQPQFYEVMQQISGEVKHLKMFSHEASQVIKEELARDGTLADFILIDGDHSYPGVRQDILDFYPLLKPGGVMLFHDFLPELDDKNRAAIMFHHADNEPGIRRACLELMEGEFNAEVLDVPLLRPTDPTQTQAHLPIIPGVFSTIRVYRKRVV